MDVNNYVLWHLQKQTKATSCNIVYLSLYSAKKVENIYTTLPLLEAVWLWQQQFLLVSFVPNMQSLKMCRLMCLIRWLESAVSTIHNFNHWSGKLYPTFLLECWPSGSKFTLIDRHFQCTVYWQGLAYDRKMVEQNLDIETTRNEDHYGAAIHHLSLLRNKRCLMAYMYITKSSQMS